ncbi:hypothetical protein CJ214_02075 [Peptoniphilus lacrimalis]|nr:hypothetical protein CYJ69_01785 [Gardnerella pickettii]PMC46098.1 hypothetical protein CJ214_02075 [Peptoniphilus lacrimalis]RIY20094.1 hypothetical protein CJI54_01530 [Bifidobacteriaceae bacterium NR026]
MRECRSSFARISRANVSAAQKQCFCAELLSAPNCLRALRFKRSGRLARKLGRDSRFFAADEANLSMKW